MKQMTQTLPKLETCHPEPVTIKTTLYELIEAISEQIPPGEDRLVAQIVLNMLNAGKIKLRGNLEELRANLISDFATASPHGRQ